MVRLLKTNYAGRTGRVIEERMGYLKILWTHETDDTPIGFTSWVRRPDRYGPDYDPEVEILF